MNQLQEMSASQTGALKRDDLINLLNNSMRDLGIQNEKLSKQLSEMEGRLENKLTEQEEKIEQKLDRVVRNVSDMSTDIRSMRDEAHQVQDRVETLETRMDQIRDLPDKVEQLDERMNEIIEEKVNERIDEKIKDMYEIMVSQQKFLEQMDADKRGKNLIFYGISEISTELGTNDTEKVKKVISKTKLENAETITNLQVKRLGEARTDSRPRPLHVSVETYKIRRDILAHAKNLKDEAGFSHVYIKKDIHPCVRKERDRILKREKEEKRKPINEGIDIKYDWDDRVLRRDGVIIDRYRPSF